MCYKLENMDGERREFLRRNYHKHADRAAQGLSPHRVEWLVGSLRFAYKGTTLRNGRLLDVNFCPDAKIIDAKGKAVFAFSGNSLLRVLKEKGGVDIARFAPSYYDKNGEGWRALDASSKVPVDSVENRLEVMLDDRTLAAGQIVRDAQCTAAADIHTEEPGYFGIGIWRTKSEANHGTLWRSAFQLGAAFTFTIGARFNKSATRSTDTTKCWTKIPAFQYADFEQFAASSPYSAPWVAVEFNDRAVPLTHFKHPPRAIYILGAEDNGLPAALKKACTHVVSIPTSYGRGQSLNVAVSGSIVMYDRLQKELAKAQGIPTLTGAIETAKEQDKNKRTRSSGDGLDSNGSSSSASTKKRKVAYPNRKAV